MAHRKILSLTVALLAPVMALVPGMAQAAEATCLTRGEAQALFSYALPQVISGTSKRCQQVLPANAYLRTHSDELVARYASQKGRYWPEAKAAFLKLGEGQSADVAKFARNLPDDSLRPLVDITVEGLVSQNLPLKSCDRIDLAIDLLSPLPPENTAGLIALIVEATAKARDIAPADVGDKARIAGLTLCKD
ncbi:hypothetical protein EDF56_101822 [Novosphingobium sp. PhB165]|uniref:hypothetical protein n=1 Tax=Novosphingobium sp. PhB165 TaxID=2485105 RepID=UPI0010D4DD05|nr:hypothetical protein [Novosphingobium sp. PhB165]TCM22140.1 hypothetical protein EDF56_101822 [Novosphingobium sp. PhB165]